MKADGSFHERGRGIRSLNVIATSRHLWRMLCVEHHSKLLAESNLMAVKKKDSKIPKSVRQPNVVPWKAKRKEGSVCIYPDDLVINHVPLDPFTCSHHAECEEQVHAGTTAWHQLTNVSTAE